MTPSLIPPSTAVRVGVRIRPLTSQEINEGGRRIVQTNSGISIGIGERQFTFDNVYDAQVSQADLYDSVAMPLLHSFIEGYNATIMAYGQTGSGKTFTMGSEAHLHLDASGQSMSSGLIPRFMADIFSRLERKKEVSDSRPDDKGQHLLEYHISASFLEVYGEDVHDLLASERQQHQRVLPLREDSKGGVVVAGLKQHTVNNAQEALQVLHEGTLNRTTAATLMNLTSSRSHAVFTIYVTQQLRQPSESSQLHSMIDVTTTSRFTFVDLAGSERMKKTGAEGERAREGIKINEGLLALGNVINALSSESNKPVHVPYRQSKLTRLLQDALGGNSQTFFLACVSPSDTNVSETLSTLHYANRARNIKNIPTKNVDASALELQRLHALTHVLQCELIKYRFQCRGDEPLGQADEALSTRPDVLEYLRSIQVAAEEHSGVTATVANLATTSGPRTARDHTPPRPYPETMGSGSIPSPQAILHHAPESSPNRSILDKVGDILLEEVNPDEEMAILDQLLELQHQDREYDKENKKDTAMLREVEGALAEQEALLLQIRESLKVYHTMKEKFEILMSEVQQLENEKSSLAVQLEKATADPSKGCSSAIAKKLERVEQSLARARTEARKHQQMYRKAEQEAQKCRALERKIHQLMQDRVQLMKKQSDAVHRHREYTEAKTREIMALKRKERTTDKNMSKLQSQIQMHKKNLDKRNAFCAKLSEKLRQTETHLTKLLTMRKRELDFRTDRRVTTTGRWSRSIQDQQSDAIKSPQLAGTTSEEVTARKFLLDKFIYDRVQNSLLKDKFEERLSAYSAVMGLMATEVNALNEARTEESEASKISELEANVEDLELKLELLHSELELLRSRLPVSSHDEQGAKAVEVISNASAPIARRLLWDYMDRIAEIEMDRQKYEVSLKLKDAALQSFESDAELLNSKIATLSSELIKSHALAESKVEGAHMIHLLESEKAGLKIQINKLASERDVFGCERDELHHELELVKLKLAETNEKLALAEAIVSERDANHSSKHLLESLHAIWIELGLDFSEREKASARIRNCLDDLFKTLFQEATTLRTDIQLELSNLQVELDHMHRALGIVAAPSGHPDGTYTQRLENMRRRFNEIQPVYQRAHDRGCKLLNLAKSLQSDLGLQMNGLSNDLQALLSNCSNYFHQSQFVPTANPPYDNLMDESKTLSVIDMPYGCLNEVFLADCERAVAALRLKKSEILISNLELQKAAASLIEEMHLEGSEIASLTLQFVNKGFNQLPECWSVEALDLVSASLASNDHGLLQVSPSFTEHLKIIHGALAGVAGVRRSLSMALKDAVEQAQKSLLQTVGGELSASEAYSSFHEALFRLPQLSKEHVDACITELNALAAGVDTLTQSEIEALTIVWEALSVGSDERGKFWVEVDELTSWDEANASCPFSTCSALPPSDPERWVLEAMDKSKMANKILRKRLYKLELIHGKVEQLRAKQDKKSRIISLDSEIRILNAKLDDFEEKKCSKQRLLTKKAGGSTLLKEERFRKQMQSTFASKLEALASLLQSWKIEERESFDAHLLSDEVRSLLRMPHKAESLVEERTEFMHLRTVKSKPSGNKSDERNPTSFRNDGSTTVVPPCRTRSGVTPTKQRFAATSKSARNEVSVNPRKRYLSGTASSRRFTQLVASKDSVENEPRESPLKRKAREDVEDPVEPRKTRRVGDEVNAIGRHLPNHLSVKKRETMLPFGHVLAQVKENAEC